MKILTAKEQQKALGYIDRVNDAILSGNEIQLISSIEYLADLTYLIGGIKEVEERSKI